MRIRHSMQRWLISGIAILFTVTAYSSPIVALSNTAKIEGNNSQGIDSFLGVPYAKAPTGSLRWQSPQLADSIQSTLQATQKGAICPQWQQGKFKGQEDCLNLDIYRPDNNKDNLPVLVYIHGGNNQTGEAHEFDPRALAESLDAIIVQVNYRLGVLGFNPLRAIKSNDPVQASGNFGLLDQHAALQWIQNNIKYFGGRADQVTVSGFSAGGRDVMAMLISPLFEDQFQQAIVFSGGMTTSPVAPSQEVFRQAFSSLVVSDGIKTNMTAAQEWLAEGSKAVKEYLQQLPAERLAPLMKDAGIRMSHFPHLYRDGVVIPKEGFDTISYNNVPIIMLSGQTEFSFFALSDPNFVKAWHSGALSKDPELLAQYQFTSNYGSKLYSLFNVQKSAEQMFEHYPSPIYGAEIAFGTNPFVAQNPQMDLIGSFHGVFMPLLDQNWQQALLGETFQKAGTLDLAKHFQAYLKRFIRTGNPNDPDLVNWLTWSPEHEKQGQSLLTLNANKHRALIQMSSKSYDEKALLDAMKNDHSLPDQAKKKMINQVLNGRWFSDALDQQFNNPSLWPKP
ncbi:para-nitrobenzyl esterase [Marinomonas polaris DSM 16579]|uniref:Carboxylic ester hydrolase n=1 Tax=Marinomonas polaris DSM 16579 TaxID=1122206 RepID=A0A1M5JQB4_9GAMM|nr:carboxylesterase family protein [Marinomonas polaris]SHG42173.1 para-nitrobenzyl esterase [Marinomonas polaris DSM 16579]